MALGRLIVDAGERSADLRYASGFSTPDDFIWFEAGDIRGVVMSSLEYNRAKSFASPGVAVFCEEEFGGPGRVEIICNIAKKWHLSGFVVPENFPLLLADKIRGRGLTVQACE